jgi:hypothetical protein
LGGCEGVGAAARGVSGLAGAGAAPAPSASIPHHCIDLHRGAFGNFDFAQHAGGGRGNLGIHLVGGNFKQWLVALHLFARLLKPLGDGAFNNGLAHLRHNNVSRHSSLSSSC